jgi:branched-subunit amino acid aminotransferase/4-amino-4-deoxychorismate lyase
MATLRAPIEVRGDKFTVFDNGTYQDATRNQLFDAHSHGLNYATGVLEGIGVEISNDGKHLIVFELNAHMARLIVNANMLHTREGLERFMSEGLDYKPDMPYGEVYDLARGKPKEFRPVLEVISDGERTLLDLEAVAKLTIEMIQRNLGRADSFPIRYLRPLAVLGDKDSQLNNAGIGVYSSDHLIEFLVHGYLWPKEYMGSGTFENGMKVLVRAESVIAELPGTVDFAKAVSNYGSKRTPWKNYAKMKGYADALLLGTDRNGRKIVTEFTSANVAIVKDGILMTPKTSCMTLPGITRHNNLQVARELATELGITEVRETDLTLNDLLHADEVMAFGTAAKVTPVIKVGVERKRNGKTEIEEVTIGKGTPGKITKGLQAAYYFLERNMPFEVDGRVVTEFSNRGTAIEIPNSAQKRVVERLEGISVDQKYDTRFKTPTKEQVDRALARKVALR